MEEIIKYDKLWWIWDFSFTDYNGSDLKNTLWLCCSPRLDVPSPVDDVTSWRGDVDGVQNGPQYLAKRSRGERKRFHLYFEPNQYTIIANIIPEISIVFICHYILTDCICIYTRHKYIFVFWWDCKIFPLKKCHLNWRLQWTSEPQLSSCSFEVFPKKIFEETFTDCNPLCNALCYHALMHLNRVVTSEANFRMHVNEYENIC